MAEANPWEATVRAMTPWHIRQNIHGLMFIVLPRVKLHLLVHLCRLLER